MHHEMGANKGINGSDIPGELAGSTYPLQHADDVLGVAKVSDLGVVFSVHDGHRLQAHALHGDLRSQQKPVIEVAEELEPADVGEGKGLDGSLIRSDEESVV